LTNLGILFELSNKMDRFLQKIGSKTCFFEKNAYLCKQITQNINSNEIIEIYFADSDDSHWNASNGG
jgi:hypothetical protein